MYTWDKKLIQEAMKWGWKPDSVVQHALEEGKSAKPDKFFKADISAPTTEELPFLGSIMMEVGMTQKKVTVAIHAKKGGSMGYFVVNKTDKVPFRSSDFLNFLNSYTICDRKDLWSASSPWENCKPVNPSRPANPFGSISHFFVSYIKNGKAEKEVHIGLGWQKMLLGKVPSQTFSVREIGKATSAISVHALRTKNTFGTKTNIDMKDWVRLMAAAI